MQHELQTLQSKSCSFTVSTPRAFIVCVCVCVCCVYFVGMHKCLKMCKRIILYIKCIIIVCISHLNNKNLNKMDMILCNNFETQKLIRYFSFFKVTVYLEIKIPPIRVIPNLYDCFFGRTRRKIF